MMLHCLSAGEFPLWGEGGERVSVFCLCMQETGSKRKMTSPSPDDEVKLLQSDFMTNPPVCVC